MGLVDIAKRQLQGAQDRLTPQRVVFHHVPKCGGTSVGRALRKRYILSQATVKPEESFRAFEIYSGRSDREQMLRDVVALRKQMMLYLMADDVRCISLHVPFLPAARTHFGDRYKFITILRDPVERFISQFHWSHGQPGAHARIEEPLETFLQTDRARRMGAIYAEFFSGLPVGADFTSQTAIDQSITTLTSFDVVGRLDDLAGFRRQIKAALGINISVGHENRKGVSRAVADDQVTAAQRQVIHDLCAPDRAIWDAIMGPA